MVLNSAAISITSEVLTFAFRSMLWLISEYDSMAHQAQITVNGVLANLVVLPLHIEMNNV